MTDRQKADEKRRIVNNYKCFIGCVDCGYKENSAALEFDHKDNLGIPFKGKQRTVASMMYSSWEKIAEEIAKCEIVCANCHAIRTILRKVTSVDNSTDRVIAS